MIQGDVFDNGSDRRNIGPDGVMKPVLRDGWRNLYISWEFCK